MAGTKYFYKDTTNTTFIVDGNIVSPGLCVMNFYREDTVVDVKSVDNKTVWLEAIGITNLLKQNGTAYTDKADLIAAVKDFF